MLQMSEIKQENQPTKFLLISISVAFVSTPLLEMKLGFTWILLTSHQMRLVIGLFKNIVKYHYFACSLNI